MTIDTLLADVSPLLPVKSVICAADGFSPNRLERYCMHTANHFPAMLQALRECEHLARQGLDFHIYSEARDRCFLRLIDIAKQAIAAATEVTQ